MWRRGSSTRSWLVGTLALLMGVFGAVSFVRRLESTRPEIGAEWVQTGQGPVVVRVDPSGAAQAAGIRPGDRLERVNGRAITSALDASSLAWEVEGNGSAIVEVRRGDQTSTLEIRPAARQGAPSVYGFLGLVAAAFLLSGTFVAIRWPSIRGGAIYFWLSAAVFSQLTLSHTGKADALDWMVYSGDAVAGALAPALLLHFVAAVSRRALPGRRSGVLAAYVPAAALILARIWIVGLGGAYRFVDPIRAVELLDRAEMFFLGASVALSVALLARSYQRTPSALHRSQARWMLWGLVVGLLPFVGVYVVPWSVGAVVPGWADLSVFPIFLVPGAFTAALARYRLNDLDTLLRRGLAEVTSAISTLAVYAIGVEVLRRTLSGILPLTWAGFRYPAILLAAASYPKLRSWVYTAVERAAYRSRYSYRATLLDWARELNAETDLATLLGHVSQRVRETLGVPEARVLVLGEDGRLGDPRLDSGAAGVDLGPDRVAPLEHGRHVGLDEGAIPALPWARHLFGMKVKGKLRAVLAVGERPGSEEPLSTEDRALLATLAAHAATAIEAARLVSEVRRHAEAVEELKASQERILESSGVGLLLMDSEGTILAWNRTLEEMYTLGRSDAIGRRIDDVFPLHAVRRVQREIAGQPEGTELRIYRYHLVNRAGRRIVVNLTISPVEPVREGGVARVVTFDDVTEQVKLEEQVLRQERLASLGLLAAGVAHEVNTPLTGISSYTQMLLEEIAEDDPRRAILEKIEAQSRRASSIANSLLNLARPERSQFEELSLDETVREVIKLFEPQIRERGIELETSLAGDLPPVRGHKGKLQQVLLNLLLNARDAVEVGGRVAVSTYARGGTVVLEVTDDGVGIAEEDLPRIFDPFFTTKGRGNGTGLGLSICYGIVREHEGEMHVETNPGEYTRFRVEFPAVRPARALA